MQQIERVRGPQAVARPRLARLVTTLAAWAAAYLVVLGILTVMGRQLTALPVPLRAAVISGVMIAVMLNLVMPTVNRVVTARFTTRQASSEQATRP